MQHFINVGANEGRAVTFDALAYAAAYSDLAAAFGNDKEALARHYVLYGYAEGRSPGTSAAAAGALTAHDTPADAPSTPVSMAAFVDNGASHAAPAHLTGNEWLGTTEGMHVSDTAFVIA